MGGSGKREEKSQYHEYSGGGGGSSSRRCSSIDRFLRCAFYLSLFGTFAVVAGDDALQGREEGAEVKVVGEKVEMSETWD